MGTPRDLIEYIRDRYVSSHEEILDTLAGAIHSIEKAFSRYESFLMEFIQNADDANSQCLRIEIGDNSTRILNDGLLFTQEDVESICKVGRSSKTEKGYIGYLGVGFKAVFLISNHIGIHSGEYHFKFDESEWPDPERTPWQVIPVWIDSPAVEPSEEYRTIFDLRFKESHLAEHLREEVRPERLNSRILLFLRSLKRIEMIDRTQNFERIIEKSGMTKPSGYETYLIQEWENDTLSSQDHWLLFRATCDVPSEVKEDLTTIEWARENVEKREVLVAFRLDNEGNLTKEEKGTVHAGVFSFLPLKEVPGGLHFLLQADFLTTPGRAEFARECLWNNWLAHEIYRLITSKCIPTFLGHEKWKMNFTDVLYSSRGGHELLESHVKAPTNRYMEENAVLVAEDGSFGKAEELISVGDEIRELVTTEDLQRLYPNRKTIHRQCVAARRLGSKIEEVADLYDFITSSEGEGLVESKARKKDVEWFIRLYSGFVDQYDLGYFMRHYSRYNKEHDEFWDSMCLLRTPIILTNAFEAAVIGDCYINPKKLEVPREVKEKLKTVHPRIEKHQRFKSFRRRLNHLRYLYDPPYGKVIRELTQEDIRQALVREEVLQLTEEKWANLSDKERIERVRELRNLYQGWSYPKSIEDYAFITLKSKSGTWERPENLAFPREYSPEHNVESLVEKELLDEQLEFVNPEFIEKGYEYEIKQWREFFEELGVDRILETRKRGIVERIGILSALQFEKKNGREARELGESEMPGYDIESRSKDGMRHIEVKSTSQSSRDMELTANEFSAMKANKDNYFVYMVLDALGKPTLHVCPGDNLLKIGDLKVTIDFGQWKDLVQEEHQL